MKGRVETMFKQAKDFMDSMVAEGSTPGCGVIVTKNGKEVFRYVTGYNSLEEKTLLKGDEYYYIYSASKITTVVAAMQLLEQGKFLLTDPLSKFIPEYLNVKVKTRSGVFAPKSPILMRHLFTMTAGLDYDFSPILDEAAELTDGRMDTVTVARLLAKKPLDFHPGTEFQYSLCHDVLAAVVEIISGMRFSEYVQKNIFDPLEMDKTTLHATPEILEKMAVQYDFVPDGSTELGDIVEAQASGNAEKGRFVLHNNKNVYDIGPDYESGGASVITCLDDYIKLLTALACDGVGANGNRILSRSSIELMRRPALKGKQLDAFDWEQYRGYNYGLGVRTLVDRLAGSSLSNVGEFGWCGAAGSACLMDPSERVAMFFVQHTLNPREEYYFPRIRNAVMAGIE